MKINVAASSRTPPAGIVPPGWGSDGLSKFWDAARSNQFGTFVNKRPIYDRLVAIDGASSKSSFPRPGRPGEPARFTDGAA
jgi:hypothetical protein